MKIKFINTAIIFSLGLSSCMKTPMACCEVPATGIVGQSMNFNSACSMDASKYEWDFGDGKTSMDQNPTHAYASAGTFTVKLMAMSKNGKKMDETTKSVTIN